MPVATYTSKDYGQSHPQFPMNKFMGYRFIPTKSRPALGGADLLGTTLIVKHEYSVQ